VINPAIPKSTTFIRFLASESKRTFSNLRSLCTTPCKWQTEIACATYLIIFLVSPSDSPSFSRT
jgi:hypothetical protein